MGRRKQSRPHRSGGIIVENNVSTEAELNKQTTEEKEKSEKEFVDIDQPFFVQVDRTGWVADELLDISEIVLINVNFSKEFIGFRISEDFYLESKYMLRFRVCNVNDSIGRIKLGHWPLLSSRDVTLELVEECNMEDDSEKHIVILSGSFDGPDESITGLVHLASLEFLTLRPVLGVTISEGMLSLRVRVEILKTAFDACESLLDNTRKTWKKSMMNVMAWLRPEVMTSEARYGVCKATEIDASSTMDIDNSSHPKKSSTFDVAAFYEAIKPAKAEPILENDMPDLLPVLRPYQRRAAYWMVQREKGNLTSLGQKEPHQSSSPLCMPVDLLETYSRMFYNPYSGNVSLHSEDFTSYVHGGILADEMGLGKTVELLACIFAHPKPESGDGLFTDTSTQVIEDEKVTLKRVKRERVECKCGAVSENWKYKGLWVQCDLCDAWQHADCVGYSPKGKKKRSVESQTPSRKKKVIDIVERDGQHICQLCSELIQATDSPVATGATLIVCPAPILPQWHAEIIRHTRPGSLKTCVYEGIRNYSISDTSVMDIGELISSDIVLTTYDVLKEDLSHDSDRHEGDRRFLRFQKRYPVIPTLLTRIFWWRICLDEAQMVESNAAAATEMALRLYTKHRWCITGTPIQRKLDDLYGLLRFLKAIPFNVSRWWIEVIRDPYERRDAGAIEFTHKFFKEIMWRSSKLHVADELQLPPQEECLSWLSFSPIEEHFYQSQHETCVGYAREVIKSLKDDMLKRNHSGSSSSGASFNPIITHAEAAKLLNSLLKLRQACCHPQVGSSGLRSLQQTPLTMDEILMVLIGKTKIEGEEALRKVIMALNGLAGIAMIENDLSQAVSLYKEAMILVEEQSEDFRLDPLLNIHLHHNLAEILPLVTKYSEQDGQPFPLRSEKATKVHNIETHDQNAAKRQKLSKEDSSDSTASASDADHVSGITENGFHNGDQVSNNEFQLLPTSLRAACENLKQKYLSVFSSKLSVAQLEFQKLYMQVCNALKDITKQNVGWWLEALDHAEENKDLSRDLIRKIEEAIVRTGDNAKSSRIASRFRSINGLKYYLQTGLDQLEASRKNLLDRLQEIDQTMEKPKEEDMERVRNCRICYGVGDGPICVHCELDELFQEYEARLFRLQKSHGDFVTSVEEAVNLQKKNSSLNQFYWYLSHPKKNSTSSSVDNEDMRKRDVREKVVVSKSPSELEVVLGVLKTYCKNQLGRETSSAANKHIHILESMRKEYALARSLAIAQAQVLRAYDEIKMSTTRLHLKEDDNDKSIDALSPDELASASVTNSTEKFISMAALSRIKGKLRYLKGLVKSKQNSSLEESSTNSTLTKEMVTMSNPAEQTSESQIKLDEESCPICQEKLSNQRMVFQCGHATCCKCLFALTEQRLIHDKVQNEWVMCPTCRQRTDFQNIAYADDSLNSSHDSDATNKFQDFEKGEVSLTVQGSYGTKIEAVTRRILWIKSTDPKAKVLVFSSWNDVLDVLEHAFVTNNITCIRMKGGRKSQLAISAFRGQKGPQTNKQQAEPKPIQVLLLLIQHGANGLNLLEAQHVILVEPLLNPAAEAQAISRVHRIGQEHKTLVHRFMVKNTVEESIYKLNRGRNTSSLISGNTKNQDQPLLTLKDVESLFAAAPSAKPEADERPNEIDSLRGLPPSMAAAIAAERRLKEQTTEPQ